MKKKDIIAFTSLVVISFLFFYDQFNPLRADTDIDISEPVKSEIKSEVKSEITDAKIVNRHTQPDINNNSNSEQQKMKNENDNDLNEEKKINVINKSKSEDGVTFDSKSYSGPNNESSGIGIYHSYGAIVPIARYGERFWPARQSALHITLYDISFWGISPEINLRYANMENKSAPYEFDSTLTLIQIFPSIVYKYEIALPEFIKSSFTLHARAWDGVARTAYETENDTHSRNSKTKIVEYLNVLGLGIGFTCKIYRELTAGIEGGYSIISTAGSPMQTYSFMVALGYRLR